MFSDTPCICVPFISNFNRHPSDVELVGMFLYFNETRSEVINISHPDKLPSGLDLSTIQLHPNSIVLDKKAILYLGYDWGIDLNSYLQYYIDDYLEIEDFYPKVMEQFNSSMRSSVNLTKTIPFSKLVEFATSIVGFVKPYFKPELISEKCVSYCEDYLHVFQNIERNEIPVGDITRKQNYWWYTATSRPSNAWGGFNFSALNKTDGTRDLLHSKFEDGKLVQFDYDAFHIKLLAKILNYEFTEHPYVQIKRELGLTEDYDHVKTRIFQNIYGGITEEFLQHPFFMQVQAIIDELYDEYTKNGFIESWFYGKRFRDIQTPTPNKVFNYFLQSLETEYNVMKIKTFLPILEGKKSTFSMYMWDAFIFDIHPDEKALIERLHRSFETDNMTVKTSIGDTFGNMTVS